MKRSSSLFLVILVTLACSEASAGQSASSHEKFAIVMDEARRSELKNESHGTIILTLGLEFLGAPYAVGLLDASSEEELIADLTQFDCVLYVETIVAMANGVAAEDYSFGSFKKRLESLRYRNGIMVGYPSRLHYFSEWIKDNATRGNVQDVTRQSGGVPLIKTLNFMSTHRESYPRMEASQQSFQEIQEMERGLEGMQLFHIPQSQIQQSYHMLRDGDILALSTHIDGLDVVHTGFAFRQTDGTFGMLHASTEQGVIVSPDLADYVKGNSSQIGIIVARPLAQAR